MLEANVMRPTLRPGLDLFDSAFVAKKVGVALAACGIQCAAEALKYCETLLSQSPWIAPQGIDYDRAMAVLLYTYEKNGASIYKPLNKLLCKRQQQELQPWRDYLWLLVQGLRDLQVFKGMLFRGIDREYFRPEEYQRDATVVWNAFTSCSRTEEGAKCFMKDPQSGVFFFIDSFDAHAIGNLTPYPEEEEVIIEPGSEFVVTGCITIGTSTVVHMRQTPSRRPLVPRASGTTSQSSCASANSSAAMAMANATARGTYAAKTAQELSIQGGDRVHVMRKDVSGWWLCTYQGRCGYLPRGYIAEDT
jgi:hypothetical protein